MFLIGPRKGILICNTKSPPFLKTCLYIHKKPATMLDQASIIMTISIIIIFSTQNLMSWRFFFFFFSLYQSLLCYYAEMGQ